MSVTAERKQEIIKDNAQTSGDPVSPDLVELALITSALRLVVIDIG